MLTSRWALRKQLSRHQVITVVLPTADEQVLKTRNGSTLNPIHREIYSMLRIPAGVMKPTKTWNDTSP